jgi:GNAT superfamily N-acetyltransferase
MAEGLPDGYAISADPGRIDVDFVHRYLSEESYWARGVPRELVARSIANSLCFGLYGPDGRQAGFARVVTDRASFAWLADVFVDDRHRGRGLGKALVATLLRHPELQGLRRFMLSTADAHGLYTPFGFAPPSRPERLLAIVPPDPYRARS